MSLARNMSKVSVDGSGYIQPSSLTSVDGGVFNGRLPSTILPSGSSIQMVSTIYQWYNSVALTTSWVNVPNMSVSITPKYLNSKIKVDIKWFGETQTAWDAVFAITRNGTLINIPTAVSTRDYGLGIPCQTYIADDNNSTPELCNMSTVDKPLSTTLVTYNLVCMCNTTGRTLMTGRVFDSSVLGSNYEQGTCEMVLTEYAP